MRIKMKSIFKMMVGAVALTAVAAAAGTPKYPFPQNRESPSGTTVKYADPSVIKAHFDKWKQAWYQDKGSEAWILSPEGTSSTVSEGIAYGMMIMVYMSGQNDDHQTEFDKLWATWKNNAVASNGGMNWRIGSGGGTGSATDADVDAALALVMASAQWGDSKYLTAAKSLISWMASNDIDGNNSVKPGSNWNDAFNPSYGALANFELFAKVTGDSKWTTVKNKAAQDLLACQNSTTGLVPDWCSWSTHQPTTTAASVAQNDKPGFFDDAARTPWRMAWSYYWYGDANAKTFNDKIVKWLYSATNQTASGIKSGYYVDGTASTARESFVSSTFSGGLGLASASAGTQAEPYLSTVYRALSAMTSCTTANGCGAGSVTGEKYYPATLNLLYMLLMTGNMPNLYDINGFKAFTPDASLAPSVSEIDGVQQVKGDTSVGLSGFWNWGAYHDKYNIGTKMSPDSGASPLFLRNGTIYAEASMEIGPEPEWTAEAAAAGTLKYPSAGIAMSFLKSEKGVDFTALGIKYVRINAKVQGPIRVALLNEATVEVGGEPGMYLEAGTDYKNYMIDLTPDGFGTTDLEILDWVATSKAPTGNAILKVASGLKFELKDAKGGVGSISVKSIEFLDAGKQVIDPVKLTGIKISNDPPQFVSAKASVLNAAKISVSGMTVRIDGANAGTFYAVFDLRGKMIAHGNVLCSSAVIPVADKGMYFVRIGNQISKVAVK